MTKAGINIPLLLPSVSHTTKRKISLDCERLSNLKPSTSQCYHLPSSTKFAFCNSETKLQILYSVVLIRHDFPSELISSCQVKFCVVSVIYYDRYDLIYTGKIKN